MLPPQDFALFLRRALWLVFLISLIGVAFSGTLSYRELFAGVSGCSTNGAAQTIAGIPMCVYGLVMYTSLALISGLALMRTRGAPVHAA